MKNKIRIAVWILIVLISLAPMVCSPLKAQLSAAIDFDSVTFLSNWTKSGRVQFTEGEYREAAAPGSATEIVVRLTDNIVVGKIDGKDTAVVILVTDSGGSGTFYDLARSPSPENRRNIRSQLVYSVADAFTIAAGPNPATAFLDMVVMVTLGRMVFEEQYAKKYGSEVAPLVKGFQTVEKDIWQIADRVLTKQQHKQLMAMIKDWRRNHPEVAMFSYVRFRDFATDQQKSKSSKPKKYSRLFGSVEKATQQVEEMRLLAERGMYLATRMPMLTGAFADVWLSQLAANPDVNKILIDLHHLSEVSERLAEVAEKLPDNVTVERQAAVKQVMKEVDILSQITLDRVMQKVAVEREAAVNQLIDRVTEERELAINHLMDRMASERRRTIEEFLSEEKRMRGLLTDLKETLTAGNDVLTVTNTLVERLNLGGATTPSEPFDIKDYQATLGEASNVIRQLKDLVETVDKTGLEQSLPQVIKIIEQIEEKGKKWVTHTVILGVVLIIIFLIGAVFAMLAYRYLSQRIFEMNRPGDFSKR